MKKLLLVSLTLMMVGCVKDDLLEPIPTIPTALQIKETLGIKLESTIVSDEVKMNVKLPMEGTYRIKIKDIGNKLISQEKIEAKAGDNILSVYVSTLQNDSYTLELTDINHKVLGVTSIVVNK